MTRSTLVLFVALLIATALPGLAQTRESHCADCHIANPDAPDLDHLLDWELSPHGRADVGCESCHGGDPTTFEEIPAHEGILDRRNPASPIYRANVPRTCGGCHPGPFVAYQKSHHFEMLGEGDRVVPVCTTCHGEVAARLLSPKALEARCRRCHGTQGKGPEHLDFPPLARRMLSGIAEVRELLDEARPLIRRVREDDRRSRLEEAWQQANVPLVEAAEAGHAFVFDELEARLAVARERATRLLDELANPAPR